MMDIFSFFTIVDHNLTCSPHHQLLDTGKNESATKEIIFGIVTRMDLLRFITNEAQLSDADGVQMKSG